MNRIDLRGLDLNLLVALEALVEEGSVTRAAERMGVSQSAMSHTLRRLREVFDDELLVRTQNGMLPTPLATRLVAPVRRGLETIQAALDDQPTFDPATARHTFTLATSDYVALVLLPQVIERVSRAAPGIDLVVRHVDERTPARIELGDIDLAIGRFVEEMPGFLRQKLFEEGFACVVRSDHPKVKRRISLQQYVRMNHVLISPDGRGPGYVDHVLREQGLERRIAVRIPDFVVAPLIIAQTDMILTLPARVARAFSCMGLRVLQPPMELAGFEMSQLFHERQRNGPAHRWLRRLIREVSREL